MRLSHPASANSILAAPRRGKPRIHDKTATTSWSTDEALLNEVRKAAADDHMSVSAWISRMARRELASVRLRKAVGV